MAFRGKDRATILAEYANYTENCITWQECQRRFPEWCKARQKTGFKHVFSRTKRAFLSRFQNTWHLVALKLDPATGQMVPDFDRVIVEEADNVHIIAYYVDEDGTYWFGVIYQIRPFVKGQRPTLCGEIPKGFTLDRVLGTGAQKLLLSPDEAATRELIEELGLPLLGKPRFLRRMRKGNTFDALSVSTIFEAQVDRHAVASQVDRGEGILASEMIPIAEYGRRVRMGIDEDGISWDAGADMATLFCFLMEHPVAAVQFFSS